MTYIEFKKWGAGPEHENIHAVEWPSVPRVGDQVFIAETYGEVTKVEWINESDGLAVHVWIRASR